MNYFKKSTLSINANENLGLMPFALCCLIVKLIYCSIVFDKFKIINKREDGKGGLEIC